MGVASYKGDKGPSPYGVYKVLRLYPTTDINPSSPCNREGEIFYYNTDDTLYYCDGIDWIPVRGGGFWTQSGSNLYPNDTNWRVGIGLTNPNNTIQVADLINFDNSLYNTFLGYQAGHSNTTGNGNTFLGYVAGIGNSTGSYNTFLGFQAGSSNSGSCNTFVGHLAGYSNSDGDNNTFLGNEAGRDNTTGNANTFLGYWAGYSNTTGDSRSQVTLDYKSNPALLHVTATNLSELANHTHLLGSGNRIWVWRVRDGQSPPVPHYVFWRVPFTDDDPEDVAASPDKGTAPEIARGDHVHRGVHSLKKAPNGTQRYGDIALAEGANITITDQGNGTFTIAASGGGGGGVTSLNTLTGDLTLAQGTGIGINDNGSDTITISNTGVVSLTADDGDEVSGQVTVTGSGTCSTSADPATGTLTIEGEKARIELDIGATLVIDRGEIARTVVETGRREVGEGAAEVSPTLLKRLEERERIHHLLETLLEDDEKNRDEAEKALCEAGPRALPLVRETFARARGQEKCHLLRVVAALGDVGMAPAIETVLRNPQERALHCEAAR